MWIHNIIMGFFSLTAVSLFGFQFIEIAHALTDFFHKG